MKVAFAGRRPPRIRAPGSAMTQYEQSVCCHTVRLIETTSTASSTRDPVSTRKNAVPSANPTTIEGTTGIGDRQLPWTSGRLRKNPRTDPSDCETP